jgi:hypothetical protein
MVQMVLSTVLVAVAALRGPSLYQVGRVAIDQLGSGIVIVAQVAVSALVEFLYRISAVE